MKSIRSSIRDQAYLPTEIEHLANIVTHGSCVLPSLIELHFMVQQASTSLQTRSVIIYGLMSTVLFSISTGFHVLFYTGRFRFVQPPSILYLKDFLHRCDRAAIYLFIASSYTPWLILRQTELGISGQFHWLIWLFACMGILYQQLYHERYKWLETLFYLLIGLVPAIIVIINMTEYSGLTEMAIGGGIYITGIYFFKSDGRIPYAHAIWHLFVIAAASMHHYAVWKYLLGEQNEKRIAIIRATSQDQEIWA